MFILISEKEVAGSLDKTYEPFIKSTEQIISKFPMKKQSNSEKNFKQKTFLITERIVV